MNLTRLRYCLTRAKEAGLTREKALAFLTEGATEASDAGGREGPLTLDILKELVREIYGGESLRN